MDRAKRKKRISIICFSVAFILCALNLFAAPAQFEKIKELEEQEAASSATKETIVRPNVEYAAEALDDPFAEPFLSQEPEGAASNDLSADLPPPNIIVQGLIWGGNFPQAIVNNKVVKIGDTIEGARIISIDKNGISIFFNERQYHLSTSLEKD